MASNISISVTNGNKQSNIDVEGEKRLKHEYSLEEAVEATKIGSYQKILIVLTGLSTMGAALENVNLSYVLPYAKCDLKLSLTEQGVLSSVSFLGIVSTSYFWGFLADTWGRQKVLCVAGLCGFCFSFSSGFAANTTVLIILRFLAGAFLAGSQAGAFSYISEFHTSKTAARAVAFSSIMLSGLAIIMSLIAMVVVPLDFTWTIFSLNFKQWRLFLICNSFINLWNGIVFAFLPESPKFLLAINEKEKALQVLRRIYAFNTGQPEQSFPVKSIKADSAGRNNLSNTKGFTNVIRLLWSQTKPVLLPPLLTHTWKMCYLIFSIYAIGHGTFMWFPEFLVQLQNYNGPAKILCLVVQPKSSSDDFDEACKQLDNKNLLSYQILLGVGVVFMSTGALSSFMMKKISPKIIICMNALIYITFYIRFYCYLVSSLGVWTFISALTCFSLNILTEFNSVVISFIVFLSCCSCANLVMAVAVNLFPTNYRGMATAFILMCGRLGGFVGSNLVGMLLAGECTSIFYINGGLLLSCILVFFTIKTGDKVSKQTNEPK